jgi:hypothetical protein
MATGATSSPGGSLTSDSGSLLMLALDHHLDAGLAADKLLEPM